MDKSSTEQTSHESKPYGGRKKRGKCKWFNNSRGIGFITPNEGGSDVFVHFTDIQMEGVRYLYPDEEVEFVPITEKKGEKATLVTKVAKSREQPHETEDFAEVFCPCGELGRHTKNVCSRKWTGPRLKRCFCCKSRNHLIANCPDTAKSSIRNG